MVGEIRDAETAQMAIRAALTGHLVFSTVHTNDAPSAVVRLIDMGMEPYMVAAAIKGVLAQRLVRVNCPECVESYRPSEAVLKRGGLAQVGDRIEFKRGIGCRHCGNIGFDKQTGIYEYFETNPELIELILAGASLDKIREHARTSGYVPLFECGLGKVIEGRVSLEELLKETSSSEDYVMSEPEPQSETVDA